MRKVGLFFGSMFAIVAAFAFTSIASASAVDIPAYEKILSNPVDFYLANSEAPVPASALVTSVSQDMSLQPASGLAFVAMLRPTDVSILAKSKSMDVRLPLPVPRTLIE
ncbi:hypothetical protein [Brucella pseudogrignonensis]|uniref:Uncharacterized protein n=1 Tax=Brucella pseudogrignonensis TaxID=419475 RepID=A0A256GF34_9HYPH|nr:hypothetical protein [Brucella pseudogrignonensis]OYR25742.1 hypothetical protein CEV34_2751 [Brucella pseudogrignonensis]